MMRLVSSEDNAQNISITFGSKSFLFSVEHIHHHEAGLKMKLDLRRRNLS